MKVVSVNYNFTPDWIPKFTDDYVIFDRSDSRDYLKDFPQDDRIVYQDNIGNVDYPKLLYLVDNYDTLPEKFLWIKTNLFKYITEEEFEQVKDNPGYLPLLTQNHRIYEDRLGPVNYYQGRMYHERIDVSNAAIRSCGTRYVSSFEEWCKIHMLPVMPYVPFPPGGNFILTRDVVHKYARDYYENMAEMLGYAQLPGEAQCAERSYLLMWSRN